MLSILLLGLWDGQWYLFNWHTSMLKLKQIWGPRTSLVILICGYGRRKLVVLKHKALLILKKIIQLIRILHDKHGRFRNLSLIHRLLLMQYRAILV